jgi:hypothetical protein
MNVNDVYSLMRFIARKNQLTSLSPAEFQYAFNAGSRNYYDFLVGRIEQYRYDKPTPRVGLSMTDNVVSRLSPFMVSATPAVTSGSVTKPANFNKLLSMNTPGNFPMKRFEQNRLAERLQDSIDPVNEANAFYVEELSVWKVYPTTLASVTLKYLTLPTDIVWAYTLDGSGRPVYNPVGSVNPQWYDNDIDEVVGRALKILGVSIKEGALLNYGQQVIQSGE